MGSNPGNYLRQAPKGNRARQRLNRKNKQRNFAFKIRRCKHCGCTENNCAKCIEAQGFPCYWVTKDVCNRCANEGKR